MDEQELATEPEDTEATVTLYESVSDGLMMIAAALILIPVWIAVGIVCWLSGDWSGLE